MRDNLLMVQQRDCRDFSYVIPKFTLLFIHTLRLTKTFRIHLYFSYQGGLSRAIFGHNDLVIADLSYIQEACQM